MARVHSLTPRSSSRFSFPVSICLVLVVLLVGCSTSLNRNTAVTNPPLMRVRLMLGQEQLTIVASQPPIYRTGSDPTPRALILPSNTPMVVTLTPAGWRIGSTILGNGSLTIQPAVEGSVKVAPVIAGTVSAARAYRGSFRLVPVSPTKFDLVNDVDIEGYLAGVLPRELLKAWHEEAYKAQAIVARTYALYERMMCPTGRYWDVFADDRSQVYGGMTDETDKSRSAVNQTQGMVVAYGPKGEERIFKAYFSSCCGGVTQSARDAFGDTFSEPLREQNNHAICNAAPRFNWGPVVIGKEELTRRIRAWGAYRKRPEKDMGLIKEVVLQDVNAWGRPTRFAITDARGLRYSLQAEEFRTGSNFDANNPSITKGKPAPTLYSSFVKVITDSDSIRFVEGHGWGHGVGLCQWCSERRAEEGMLHEDIVMAAYPSAKQVRAY